MKKLSILVLFLAFASMANAQTKKLIGSWLMTRVEVDGDIHEPYFITDFKENGKVEAMGMDAGTWKYDKANHSLIMESELDKDFNGEGKILKLNKTELVISKDGAKIYYQKIEMENVVSDNTESKLEGTWKIGNSENTNTTSILKMELPDSFVLVETGDGSTSTTKGTWMYNAKGETVIFIGFSHLLRGKNTLVSHSEDKFVLNNNGNTITALKENVEEAKIERLTFGDEDFYDENGEYKYYDDEYKLPWQDAYGMIMSLVNVKHLVYDYATLIEGTDAFQNKTLTANVNANGQEGALSIDYIFNGYDNYNLPEDTQLPPNTEYTNLLYPLNGDTFRIVGTEPLTTAAGTFDCTLIEAIGDFEIKLKLWMITDKPGIYAKIIQDKPGSFGHYAIYELQEIKND